MEATVLPDASASVTAAERIGEVLREANVDVKDCYQCGKCSAGCPVAASADATPREVIRYLQLGLLDEALHSNMPWYCVGCGMCLARCPQNVDLPNLNNALRHAGKAAGIIPVKEVDRFDKAFVGIVRTEGVSDEAILAMQFNLTTGHLFQDVMNSPKMLTLGMINGSGHKVQGKAEVKQIVDAVRARKAQGTQEAAPAAAPAADPAPQNEGGAQ